MGRGRHHSLPKYLRTVFLPLGPEPRPLGQALTASISLVSLRQAGPGHREGKLEEAGAWLTLRGGWEMQRTVACLLILPQPTRQQESGCIPKARGLLSEERLESWGREGGPPSLPEWRWEESLLSGFLRLFGPLKAGAPQGQAESDKLLPALHPGREAVPGGRADRKK